MKYIGRQDEYERWRNIGYILKNLNIESYEIYDEWSKKSNKYSNDIKKFWENHKPNNSITIRALKHYVKIDKMEGYREVIEEEEEERLFKTERISNRYISNKKGIIEKPNEKTERMNDIIYEWMKSDEKFIAIKSPYDTGKTTLMKSIMNSYPKETKRVLYITYRQTLARNVRITFQEYEFKNYLDGEYGGERQIIQLDSINKIEGEYDMVIIDEIESVLAHLTGGTIRNKGYKNSEFIFERMRNLIKETKRVIARDIVTGKQIGRAHV